MRIMIEPALFHIACRLNDLLKAYRCAPARRRGDDVTIITGTTFGKNTANSLGSLALEYAAANRIILRGFNCGIFARTAPGGFAQARGTIGRARRVERADLGYNPPRLGMLERVAPDTKAVTGLTILLHINRLKTVAIL